VGVGSGEEGELDGDGDTCALATDPGHVASDSRSVASISPIRTLVAPPPLRFFIVPQALPGDNAGRTALGRFVPP